MTGEGTPRERPNFTDPRQGVPANPRNELSTTHLSDEHLDGCAEILAEAFAGEPWREDWTHEAAARRLNEIRAIPGSVGLVAVDEVQTVVGFLLGARETTAKGEVFCVQWICVRPGMQGKGIARGLLEELKRTLETLGVRSSYLLTLRDRGLETFYERCGYRRDPRYVIMKRPEDPSTHLPAGSSQRSIAP